MTTFATDYRSLTGEYTLDPSHTRIGFVARHAMVTKVRGVFTDFSGSASVDGDNPEASTGAVRIKVDSVDTGNADRDNHLRTNDFLQVEDYPEITFTTTSIEQTDDDVFEVAGDLTIKGVTRPVSIPFTYEGVAKDPFGNTRIGLTGSTTINRKEFGVTWNAALETGGVLVGDKVTLEFDVSAIKSE
jgi:polyisoprenoid-binding protein YceI